MPPERLVADLPDADAFDAGRRAGEVAVHELMVESEGFKNLRAAVGLYGRDPHLRKNLQQAFVDGLDELRLGRGGVDAFRQVAVPLHVHERFKEKVRVDGARAEADQAREVMDVARLPGFKDQADFRAGALAHEMMVDRGDAEQARDRRPVFIHAPVAQDEKLVAVGDCLRRLPAELIHGDAEAVRSVCDPEQHAERFALEMRVRDLADFFQVSIRENRLLHFDAAAGFGGLLHHVRLRPDVRDQRHHELLADRINRGIRHLREELLEVLEQELRPLR